MMRLLIADDDAALAGFLRKGMEAEGYQVKVVADGEAALQASFAEAPDLLILDLKMPRMDGNEVLRHARQAGALFPILVLTGQNEPETRLACLDMGADDCMFKPFSLGELRARCRALLRRANRAQSSVVEIPGLILHRLEREAVCGGRRISLTNREYALLEQLVLEGGRCVMRSTLLERVWNLGGAETNVVDVYVNYLRRKLDDGERMSKIETVRGKGYRIAMTAASPLAAAAAPTLSGAEA